MLLLRREALPVGAGPFGCPEGADDAGRMVPRSSHARRGCAFGTGCYLSAPNAPAMRPSVP